MEQEDRDMLLEIHTKVSAMEEAFKKDPYPAIVQMVKNHSKIFWLALVASTGALIKSFSGN